MGSGGFRAALLVLAFLAVGGMVLVLAGVGEDDGTETQPAVARSGDAENKKSSLEDPVPVTPEKTLPESTCPSDLAKCVVASGRVLYVEKVDPDGDGDAHFVTASAESVTGPGITIFDVRTDLRPDPLPGIGDLVGGAGPVFRGHAGQKQIEVVTFSVAE